MPTIDHCLHYRGFLLETAPSGKCRLSTDAHAADAADLRHLLTACGLMQTVGFDPATGEFTADMPAPAKASRAMLTAWGRCKVASGYQGTQEEWPHFRRCVHGIKVPVRQLEPGVALLVKALNTVGATTWCSCATHGEICLLGAYAAAWAKFLVVDWAGADPDVLVFNGTVLSITANSEPLLNLTAVPAAQIYTQRQALRKLRMACVNQWPAAQPPPADAFYQLAKKLFPKFGICCLHDSGCRPIHPSCAPPPARRHRARQR